MSIKRSCLTYSVLSFRSMSFHSWTYSGPHLTVYIRKESILERCTSYRGAGPVRILECLSQRGVHLRYLSDLQRCLFWKDVYQRQLSVLERCQSLRCLHLLKVSIWVSSFEKRWEVHQELALSVSCEEVKLTVLSTA